MAKRWSSGQNPGWQSAACSWVLEADTSRGRHAAGRRAELGPREGAAGTWPPAPWGLCLPSRRGLHPSTLMAPCHVCPSPAAAPSVRRTARAFPWRGRGAAWMPKSPCRRHGVSLLHTRLPGRWVPPRAVPMSAGAGAPEPGLPGSWPAHALCGFRWPAHNGL